MSFTDRCSNETDLTVEYNKIRHAVAASGERQDSNIQRKLQRRLW